MKKTLLLNATYEPIGFIQYRHAIKLICNQKVEVISNWNDIKLTSISSEMYVPSILRLNRRVKNGYKVPRFSRLSVFNRDDWTCAYCGKTVTNENATIDHITPRSKGGKTSWLNCITACLHCNKQKGNLTLDEFNKKLLINPVIPLYCVWNKPRKEDWNSEWFLYFQK